MVSKVGKFYALSNGVTHFTSNPSIHILKTEEWQTFGRFGQNEKLKMAISSHVIATACRNLHQICPIAPFTRY